MDITYDWSATHRTRLAPSRRNASLGCEIVMVIMMMIMMLPGGVRLWFHPSRHWGARLQGWGIILRNPADRTEPVLRRVRTATGKADARLHALRHCAYGSIRVHLRTQSLDSLQSGRNGFRAGLGLVQVLLQSPEQIFDCRIVREVCLRPRRRQIPDGSGWLFMIHSARAILVEKNTYRLENSIFPSVSVAAPLHIAGR